MCVCMCMCMCVCVCTRGVCVVYVWCVVYAWCMCGVWCSSHASTTWYVFGNHTHSHLPFLTGWTIRPRACYSQAIQHRGKCVTMVMLKYGYYEFYPLSPPPPPPPPRPSLPISILLSCSHGLTLWTYQT